MPELAEVETVRRTLKSKILNEKIIDLDIYYEKIIENNIRYFKNSLINDEFIDILRKGKYLIFETKNKYMISHLRMEGKYEVKRKNLPKEKHEHVIFRFQSFDLSYVDTRKFGRMKIIDKDKLEDYFKNIGPDANLIKDVDPIYKKISNSSLPIKTLLLDQSIIAGLGNIYADEVLFLSKINPLRKGKTITKNEVVKLVESSKSILEKAIEYKGTTIRTYTSSHGIKGEYQKFLKVHTKEICECKNPIIKKKIRGRSTYYCNECQK